MEECDIEALIRTLDKIIAVLLVAFIIFVVFSQ